MILLLQFPEQGEGKVNGMPIAARELCENFNGDELVVWKIKGGESLEAPFVGQYMY